MNNKLYVGNLPYQVSEDELEKQFATIGPVVSVKIIKDFDSGRSKGFGFIEMENAEDAQKCIDGLDGSDFGGRGLRVSIARNKAKPFSK